MGCTSPLLGHPTCCQEKIEWIQEHFGEAYIKRMILCQDKTTVRADILVDDKPFISGLYPPTWQQCLFNAPYNQTRSGLPRMIEWSDWESPLRQILEKSGMKHVPSATSELCAHTDFNTLDKPKGLAGYVDGLRDFSSELQAMGVYLSDYTKWRKGKARGAKGEALEVLHKANDAYMRDATNECDEPSEIFCFRQDYISWRRGRSKGARGEPMCLKAMSAGA